MRKLPALLAVGALLTAALAGCTGLPGTGGCAPEIASGDSSKLVSASGEFPTPLVVKTPELSVIEAGDGPAIPSGSQVDFSYSQYDGADGKDLNGSATKGRTESGLKDSAVSQALVCAHVGDKLALVLPAGEGADQKTGVIVIDVTASYLGKADGFNQLPQDGMPLVATEVDGTPGVSVLLQEPPATERDSVIKAGDGAVVKKGDVVVSHIRIFTWPTGEGSKPAVVDQYDSWSQHSAVELTVKSIADGGGLPDGLMKAVEGARIGSQLLIVEPPGTFPSGGTPGGDDSATVIIVLDLLGILK